MQKQFCDLRHRLVQELKTGGVSVERVLEEVTWLPFEVRNEYEGSIQRIQPRLEKISRISTLMNHLNTFFTFLDYGLLEHLISKLGSKEVKEDMTMYVNRVGEFMRETTVNDMIDCWPGDVETQRRVDFSKLITKFKDDPKTYTLERLNNFRRKFCSRTRLSEFLFGLVSLEPAESFYAMWLTPADVVPEVIETVKEIDISFCDAEHILSISVGQEQLYPPAGNFAHSATSIFCTLHEVIPLFMYDTPQSIYVVHSQTHHPPSLL